MSDFNTTLLLMVGWMLISMQVMHNMIRFTHLLTDQKKNQQECTAHSKLQHNLPTRKRESTKILEENTLTCLKDIQRNITK